MVHSDTLQSMIHSSSQSSLDHKLIYLIYDQILNFDPEVKVTKSYVLAVLAKSLNVILHIDLQ